jgi:hypothetical protein
MNFLTFNIPFEDALDNSQFFGVDQKSTLPETVAFHSPIPLKYTHMSAYQFQFHNSKIQIILLEIDTIELQCNPLTSLQDLQD